MNIPMHTWKRIGILLPYLLFSGALLLLVQRSFYSFSWVDESFYVALADRLHDGAAPFLDEWHPAQVYAPLLLPLYTLYVNVTGGTDGIVLFFRLSYILVSFVVALFVYRVLSSDFGRFASCAIALCYLFYARANIQGPSYYSLCTTFFLLGLACSWLAFRWHREHRGDGAPGATRVLAPLLAGAFFALSVVCNPYVVVIFFLACLAGLVCALRGRQPKLFVPFLWAIAGTFVVAACYLCFVFARVSPAELVANLGNVLNSHDENLTLAQRIPDYLMHLPVTRIGFLGTAALCLVLVVWRARRKSLSSRAKSILLAVDAALLLYTGVVAYLTATHPNALFIAFVEFAVPCYLMADDLRPTRHPELFLFWVPGILLSLVWQFSSNTQICGIIIGFSIASYGAIITVLDVFGHETPPAPQATIPDEEYGRCLVEARIANLRHAACVAIVALLVVYTAAVRMTSVYSDCPPSQMVAAIDDGPAAGLLTSEQHLREYEGVRELVAHIDGNGGVWILPMAPWAYLEAPGPCAAPSAWDIFVSQEDWSAYYGEQGHAEPTWIVVTDRDAGEAVNVVAGREKAFPALEMYYDYDEKLDAALSESALYKPFYANDYGTLYKHVEFSAIEQG